MAAREGWWVMRAAQVGAQQAGALSMHEAPVATEQAGIPVCGGVLSWWAVGYVA
jgi:hypothetical protein